MLKIATILGARPQFIKAATVSRAISEHNKSVSRNSSLVTEVIIHTGQHYDENMSKIFFDELEIPKPDYNLGIGSGPQGWQTSKMLAAIEEVLVNEQPHIVLTYGDTNSTLAGALAASKLHMLSAHVEAGLRSYNREMPEEINRIVADKISNILFCPTETAVNNLSSEGMGSDKIGMDQPLDFNHQRVFNVGDVMYDSILYNRDLALEKSNILVELGLAHDESPQRGAHLDYCVATVHRPENSDDPDKLREILASLQTIAERGLRVFLPLHPRTRNKLREFNLEKEFDFLSDQVNPTLRHGSGSLDSQTKNPMNPTNSTNPITVLPPLSYLDMIRIEMHAKAIFTDSGGMQKEALFLGVPCITMRNETEWVETVEAGWNILTGASRDKIIGAFSLLEKWNGEEPPFSGAHNVPSVHIQNKQGTSAKVFGDGKAAEKIIETLEKVMKNQIQ
jgi:UDP-GlcNAc3NAcA epimerase